MFHSLFESFITLLGGFGYKSIFFLMALESSLFPVPSEAVMIPAGYLAATGKLDFALSLLAGTLGSMLGATANYILGKYVGKPFLWKYGKYFLINHKKYEQAEGLFVKNDKLYTFLGRLIPVVRHLISIPAGIFRMNYVVFITITGAGAALWCTILLALWYYFGEEVVKLVSEYTHEASILVVIALIIGAILFLKKKK